MAVLTYDQTGQSLILGRDLRFWIMIGVIVTLVFVITITVLLSALVRITYSFADQARPGNVTLKAVDREGKENDIFKIGDFAIIPRATVAITAKTSDSTTIRHITTLPFFEVPSFQLTLQPQHQLSKLGAGTLGCNLVNPNGTFTYNCATIANVDKINRPDTELWENSPAETGRAETIFERYQNGFLGIATTPNGAELRYIVPGASVQTAKTPSGFADDPNDSIEIITDVNNTNTAFILANHSKGRFWLLSNFGNAVQAEFKRKAETDPQFNIEACALNKSQLACFYGPDTHDHDNTDEHENYRKTHKDSFLEITPLDNTEQSKVAKFDSALSVDQLYQTSNAIFARGEDKTYGLTVEGDTARAFVILSGVTNAEATSASLFFVTNDTHLYEFKPDEQTAYLRFHSDNLTSLSLSTYGEDVLINAFINVDDTSELASTAHVFRLSNQVLPATMTRKEDKLPYKDNTLPIEYMDYSDTKIYVNLKQSFITNSVTGERQFDTADIGRMQTIVLERLRQDGLLNNQMTVLFR